MKKAYIRHKVSVGEVHNISDKESKVLIENQEVTVGDFIEIIAPNGIYNSVISFIDTASIEVEILNRIEKPLEKQDSLHLIQAALPLHKMRYVVEKCVELGVERISPILAMHSDIETNSARNYEQQIDKVVRTARNQSLTQNYTELERVTTLKNAIEDLNRRSLKICLTTENVKYTKLSSLLREAELSTDREVVIAVGPVKGWDNSEITLFKSSGFQFVSLGDNILRSETAGIVAITGIKFHKGEI